MLKPVFVSGIAKWILYARICLHVFLRATLRLAARDLTPRQWRSLLRGALLLLRTCVNNKAVRIGGVWKLQLYFPAYPTPAFWESLEKFVRPDPGPLTVVLSMTKACGYKCPHCYQRNDGGPDLDAGLLKRCARDMQEMGTTMFDIEGGEPLLRFERLLDLLSAFDGRRELWVNTTGHTLTPERARRLKEAGVFGVMISLHDPDPQSYEAFTGFPASFAIARDAARMFNEAGITVALNSCPTGEIVDRGGVERIMDLAKEWGCSYVQVIHGKSAGAWLGKQDEMIAAREKIRLLERLHLRYNAPGRFRDHPSAAVQVYEESPAHFGCTAGGIDRFYLNANGEVQPCEFLNVSFGNVNEEPFKVIFRRMRAYFRKPGTRWLCATEAPSIHAMLKEKGVATTPLPWRHTRELMRRWEFGPHTRLYEDMDIYR